MSNNISTLGSDRDTSAQHGSPAFGVIATGERVEPVLRTVARAQVHGCHPIVITSEGTDELRQVITEVGADFVEAVKPTDDTDILRRELVATVRENSFPGVIVHDNPAKRVDFQRSLDACNDSQFVVDAALKVDHHRDANVVAGIPAYNEASTIGNVVSSAREFVDEAIVVDDGSDDETAVRAREAGAHVITHEQNRGYGAALKTLFEAADERSIDYLVVLDGDNQHDPSDIAKLVDHQRETGANIVIGSRFDPKAKADVPLYRQVGIRVVNLLTNVSMGNIRPSNGIEDTQSGFRVYDRSVIKSLAREAPIGDQMEASTDILYHANENDYQVDEVGINVRYDVENANNHHPLAHGVSLVSNILQTIETERPITVLGLPGFFSIVTGCGFGYWAIANYLETSTFSRGLAIIAVFFVLAGVFACFTAIILHALNSHLDDR